MNFAELKNKGLSLTAKAVLMCLADGVAPSPSALARALEISRWTAKRALDEITDVAKCTTDVAKCYTDVAKCYTDVAKCTTDVANPVECSKMLHPASENFSGAYNVFNKDLKDNINIKKQNITKELSTADVNNILALEVTKKEKIKAKEKEKENEKRKEKDGTTTELTYAVISYLNEKLSCKYRAGSRLTQGLVAARVAEGFAFEDFVAVIDTKSAEWLSDDKMRKFLRPETLFSNKFEGYLNQSRLPKPRVRGSPKTQGNWVLLEERLKKYEEEEEAERSEQK